MYMSDSFSLANYRALLQFLVSTDWTFKKFTDAKSSQPRELLLRHDIDAELYLLDSFLDVEAAEATKSTYFVMTESPFYNLSSPEGRRITKRINASEHSIGLHFFGEIHAHLPQSQLETEIQRQAMALADTVGSAVNAFSFHQPTPAMLKMNLDIPGLTNTYHKALMDQFTYVSDTNMNWRPLPPRDVIHEGATRVQLLIHPLWWVMTGSTPVDRWRQVLIAVNQVQAHHLLAREGTLTGLRIEDLTS